jgi:hypothetical protein
MKYFPSLPNFVEWKVKLEACEKEMQEWKNKTSRSTTNISKINRQISSKVRLMTILFSPPVFMNSNSNKCFLVTGDTDGAAEVAEAGNSRKV